MSKKFIPGRKRMSTRNVQLCEKLELSRQEKHALSIAGKQESRPRRLRRRNADGDWVIIDR